MELENVLDEKIMTVSLKAADKDDALKQMARQLKENGYIADVEAFVADIYKREKEGITGIGNGVAIPHGKSDSVSRIGVAVANLEYPIKWETLDGKPIETIFLFCVSNDQNFARNHMILLSRLAAKLADDELLDKIKQARCPRQIREYLLHG